MPVQKPRARTDDLVIEEVDDELLVYDSTNKRGHCLSATAARVWRACDGHSDVSALSEALELDAEVVSQALDELEALELLDTQGLNVVQAGSGNGDGLTRRQLARRSARVGAGLAAAPLVYSINVSSAMALATPTPFQCNLFTVQSCGTSSGCGRIAGCCCCCQGDAAAARPAARSPSADAGTPQPCSPAAGRRLRDQLLRSMGDNPADDARLLRRGRARCNCGCGFGAGHVGAAEITLLQRRTRTPDCTPGDGDANCVPVLRRLADPQPSRRTARPRPWLLQVRNRQLLRELRPTAVPGLLRGRSCALAQ